MADVSWIKLKVGMFDDEKVSLIESLPDKDAILIIWVRLLLQAGKTNANGYIFLTEKIPYTEEMLASIFRRPLNTVRLALQTFVKLEMVEVDEKGILVLNWEKHQSVEKLELIRESGRKRFKKWYDNNKIKQNQNSLTLEQTHSNTTDIDKEKESKNILPAPEENQIQNLWIRTIGRNPKQPEFEETEKLLQKYGQDKVYDTFKKAALRNIKSLQYLLDNVDADFNLLTYTQKNNNAVGETKTAAHQYID